MAVIKRVQNTTSPNLRFQATRKGQTAPINLTGASVDALLYLNGALINSGRTSCQITDPVNGMFLYNLQAADTATTGTIAIDLLITYASGETEIQPKSQVMLVRAR